MVVGKPPLLCKKMKNTPYVFPFQSFLKKPAFPAILCLIFFFVFNSRALSEKAHIPDGRGWNAVVASENEICSDIGVDILKLGGSAVDSAIAATICLGLTNPQSSGVGGGGFLVYYNTREMEQMAVNFREMAGAAATRDMFNSNPKLAQRGALSVGVPGELRGLEAAHHRYGVLPWKTLLSPAINLARNGFRINWRLSRAIAKEKIVILQDQALSSVFAPNGKLLIEGDIMYRTKFADTLSLIAESGADVFYNGEISKKLVKTISDRGGILTEVDFSNYQPLLATPMRGTYRQDTVLTAPPPASGSIIISALNILEHIQENELDLDKSEIATHKVVETFKHIYAQRGYCGDPHDTIYSNISAIARHFCSKNISDVLFSRIKDDKTFSPEYYEPKFDIVDDHGTMHVSIITADGEALALTSTINLSFGSLIMDPETGVILNDQMDDFSIPGVSNAFGLAPSPYNYIQPGKRPMSSSSPTIIIRDGFPVVVAGASGGSQIISSTLQVLLRMLDMNQDPLEAVHAPRFHHQLLPNILYSEEKSQEIIASWISKGHNVSVSNKFIFTGVSAVKRLESGIMLGSGDSRKSGAARGF